MRPLVAPQFIFGGTGTRGDLIPLLAIAAEVQRRGHAVQAHAHVCPLRRSDAPLCSFTIPPA